MNKKEAIRLVQCGIYVSGECTTKKRRDVVEDAISAIQKGDGRLKGHYFGVKRYAHFDDQRCDCCTDMGPKHGGIIFRVGDRERKNGFEKEDCIDLLLYVLQNPKTDVFLLLEKYRDACKVITDLESELGALEKADVTT
jgi:hypothetical protein